MWRFRVLNGGINLTYFDNYNPNSPGTTENLNANFSVSIGREKRKELAPNTKFIYGIEISSLYSYYRNKDRLDEVLKSHQLRAGIVGVIGIRYDINQKFYANAELLPALTYQFRNTNSNSPTYFGAADKGYSLGFGNNSALLSVGLKF